MNSEMAKANARLGEARKRAAIRNQGERAKANARLGEGGFSRPGWIQNGVLALLLLFMAAPTLVIIPVSFSSATYLTFPPPGWSLQWYQKYFSSSGWLDATARSLLVAACTAGLAVTVGTLTALGLQRIRRGRDWVRLLVLLPMIVPGIIIAISMYKLYADLGLIGTILGLTVAHTLIAFPFVALVVSSSLEKLDPAFERAAASLGAGPVRGFFLVTLPLVRPGMLSGALLAFITSFDEVVISIFIGGSRASTLPKMMWDSIRTEVDPTIGAISCLLIALSTALLVGVTLIRAPAHHPR